MGDYELDNSTKESVQADILPRMAYPLDTKCTED